MDILRTWNIFLEENKHRIGCTADVLRVINEFKQKHGNSAEMNLLEGMVRDVNHITYKDLRNRIDDTARRICDDQKKHGI